MSRKDMRQDPGQEVERRLALERQKALTKYGRESLAEGGHPDLNIADYLLNELVGLIRYAQMLRVRARGWAPVPRELAESLADRLERHARRDAENLARILYLVGDDGRIEGPVNPDGPDLG